MKRKSSNPRGVALVVVLASLILLAALVLAFLTAVGTELRSSKAYSVGTNARLLSQTAANLALAQISEATSGQGDSGLVAWASQPGMIRTYDNGGNPSKYYKLFSWTDMTGDGAYDATSTENSVPASWKTQRAVFTDLNEPLRLPHSDTSNKDRLVFPIIDGNGLTNMPAVSNNLTYGSGNVPDVDGFYVSKNASNLATSNNPVPMPVKWLYVLEDGKIQAPVPYGENGVKVDGASKTNKIVGRIAFWTDDETCKININTASEGTYADMPRANFSASVENSLTKNQPVQGEYQRYPGHPAMTSLSTVFKNPPAGGMSDEDWAERLYEILPRVKTGGSREGKVITTRDATPIKIFPDADRLFASVDEMAFKPQLSGTVRGTNDFGAANFDVLKRDQFFLTPFSRAPEVNLFNKPRVSIWPIYANEEASHLTAFDRLMAFCGKMNGHTFFFQRQDPTSSTVDLPASGGSSGLSRNRSLLEYLRSLASSDIPGFGGNFRSKYGDDTDQILTEIFDYIRITNLADVSISDPAKRYTVGVGSAKAGLGQVVPIIDSKTGTKGFGRFPTVEGASLLMIANADGDDPKQTDENGSEITDASKKVAAGKVRVQAMFILQLFDPSMGSVFNFPNFKFRVSGLDKFTWGEGSPTQSMNFGNPNGTFLQNATSVDGSNYGGQIGFTQTAETVQGAYVSASIDLSKTSTIGFSGGEITIELMDASGVVVQKAMMEIPSGSFPVPKIGPQQVTDTSWDGKSVPNPKTVEMRYFTGKGRLTGIRSQANSEAWFIDSSGGDGNPGYDVVRSVSCASGDVRLIGGRANVPKNLFAPVNPARWSDSSAWVMGMHNLWTSAGEPYYGALIGGLAPLKSPLKYEGSIGNGGYNQNSIVSRKKGGIKQSWASDAPFLGVAAGKSAQYVNGDLMGDWDNAPPTVRDGPYINKPDEGSKGTPASQGNKAPYDWGRGLQGNILDNATLFTPNRLIPSAVTFGSLPSGVLANRPWQTLLFRPDPTGLHAGNKGRRGDGSSSPSAPADHLWLDLFTMPVVEPYAISEPLSTAGKINMNYQIVPFTYINRDTGIRAVLKAEKVIALRDADVAGYKANNTPIPSTTRIDVDPNETLKGFQRRFDSKDIFRSATEICELQIVPKGTSYDGMAAFWDSHQLTGDNSKERPYATIYPRLTTKSNTYTIYLRVQSLQAIGNGDPSVWDETKDEVLGEYRGSQTVERYIDPLDGNIPDYADSSVSSPISDFYKFRILQAKQFSP